MNYHISDHRTASLWFSSISIRAYVLMMFVLVCFPGSASATARSFTEDFTTTTYKDPVHSIADWDTTAGELRLPPLPSLAGSYDTPGYALGVAVAGDLAFVADEGSGLQVIDISDPTNPVLTGS
jgi:hypothetical protein